MALRFRKTFKLAPGVRWTISGSGSSWSFGPRGASISVGKRGVYANYSIPGTGLSYRERLGGRSETPSAQLGPPQTTKVSLTCGIDDEGVLSFTDGAGMPLSEAVVEAAKKQNRDAILALIQRKCDELNDQVEALGRLHHDTPDSRVKPKFEPQRINLVAPERPTLRVPTFLEGLRKSVRLAIQEENDRALARFEGDTEEFERQRRAFYAAETKRRVLVEQLIYQDVQAMEDFLEANLQDIVWPRETQVAVDIGDGGLTVQLDVDLPEIENMPTKSAAVPARGLKLSVKELPAAKVRRLYADHVHGIVFRLVGETFAALPVARTVVVSGYSQRSNSATGHLEDQYLLSVKVAREAWEQLAFDRLAELNVVDSLARHELRRDLTRIGELRPIRPFQEEETCEV
ncbi:DUF4236 domain-containing protein [Methylibium petroleiphilum]|uniref:DUF4236 domain-containing protein n=1 Tax=Methylibium petroleiphilum (strain ATCC BAA-1232 / LMG 22953 / PM1) TaxID=420662 RepID=A2SMN9_METPP|nr:DUF4236 domain-containing protein [Methylibium petroleiphilum]ABM96828.1 conserved hypothetical protein [Methylibium petroleiphilum PM1]